MTEDVARAAPTAINAGSFDVALHFHQEAETWWADSPDLPGWTAAADTFSELMDRCRESLIEMGKARFYATWELGERPSEAPDEVAESAEYKRGWNDCRAKLLEAVMKLAGDALRAHREKEGR